MTLREMEECDSYYVLERDQRPLIASGCRSSLWRAITNLSASHIILFLTLVVVLLVAIGVLLYKFLRNRQLKKPDDFRGLPDACRAELDVLTTADRQELEVTEAKTVETETVVRKPQGVKYQELATEEARAE